MRGNEPVHACNGTHDVAARGRQGSLQSGDRCIGLKGRWGCDKGVWDVDPRQYGWKSNVATGDASNQAIAQGTGTVRNEDETGEGHEVHLASDP